MMRADRYQLIYEWCFEAMECLQPHLTEESHSAFSDLIEKERRSKAIYDTAVEIAIMIGSLSLKERTKVDEHLVKMRGLSSKFFLDNQLKKARKILQKGVIKTDAEYDLLKSVALDQEAPPQVVELAGYLLAEFEFSTR